MATSVEGTASAGRIGSGVATSKYLTIKNAFVPETVKPGAYRLRMAFKPTGEKEWRLITTPLGNAHDGNSISAIPFTVTAAKKSTAGISLETFSPRKTDNVIQDEEFTVSVKLKNNSSAVFSGEVGAVLADDAGKILQVIGSKSVSKLKEQATGSSTSISCAVPKTVKEGRYTLRIAVKTEGKDWEIVTQSAFDKGIRSGFDFSVVAKEAKIEDYGFVLETFRMTDAQMFKTQEEYAKKPMLSAIEQNEAFRGGYSLSYTEKYATGRLKGDVGIVLVDKADNIAAFIWTRDDGSLSASIQKLTIPKTVKPGQYKLKVALRPEGKEWRIVKYVAPGAANDIPLMVTAAK
jgi:hypothetical protein